MAKDKAKDKDKAKKSRQGDFPTSLVATVDGNTIPLTFREFKTSTLGYYGNGKILVDGKKCQVSVSIYVVHSKEGEENG